jgi:hypothetical protein
MHKAEKKYVQTFTLKNPTVRDTWNTETWKDIKMDAWKIGCENVNWIELSKIIILSISLL